MRIGGVGLVLSVVALLLSSCGGSSHDETSTCAGESTGICAAFCGSDVVGDTVCVQGRWQCPEGMVNGVTECPAGTCFGPPAHCCNPKDQTAFASGVCQSSEDFLPSGGGVCPDGFYDCTFGMRDAGAAGADAGG